jgi:hypothetical protein
MGKQSIVFLPHLLDERETHMGNHELESKENVYPKKKKSKEKDSPYTVGKKFFKNFAMTHSYLEHPQGASHCVYNSSS